MHMYIYEVFSILRQNEYYIIDTTSRQSAKYLYTRAIFTRMHWHYIKALYYTKAFLVGICLINTWNNLL